MLKKISVDDLSLGMYLHGLCGPWVDHPFWKSRFELRSAADLAAFYSTEAKADPAPKELTGSVPADVAEVLKKGNCASCHGANFSTPIDPSYPKLAGQHADYLYIALKEYQTDKNPQVGRNNAIMMGMARPFTHAEAKQLAAYFATLPGELKTVPQSRWR